MIIVGKPGSYAQLRLTANVKPRPLLTDGTLTLNLTVYIEECVPGEEYLDTGECVKCG